MDRAATKSSSMYEAVLQRYDDADHWASLEPPTFKAEGEVRHDQFWAASRRTSASLEELHRQSAMTQCVL